MKPLQANTLFLFLTLTLAYVLPLTQDEAYYLVWSQNLDFGYFDHPPMVAWMIAAGQKIPWLPNILQIRFFAILSAWISFILIQQLFLLCKKHSSYPNSETYFSLLFSNLALTIAGIIITPDSPLLLFWAAATLAAGYAILEDRPKLWLLAGLFTGFALLSKYTALVLGLVYLAAISLIQKQHFSSRYLYAGGLIAFLVFSPNIWWNSQHDMITWKFQLRHGLSLPRDHISSKFTDVAHVQTFEAFKDTPIGPHKKPVSKNKRSLQKIKLPKTMSSIFKTVGQVIDFLIGQLCLFGLSSLVFCYLWIRSRRDQTIHDLNGQGVTYLGTLTLIPLIVFAAFSLKGKVEANWAAMYSIGAVGLICLWSIPKYSRPFTIAATLNIVLLCIYCAHSLSPFLPITPIKDRILKETHGYQELAQTIQTKGDAGLVFTDTYQLASMIRAHAPSLKTLQWPGLSRNSQYLDANWWNYTQDEINRHSLLKFVTSSTKVPRLAYRKLQNKAVVFDCANKPELIWSNDPEVPESCQLIHRWYYHELKLDSFRQFQLRKLSISKQIEP